MAKDSKRERAGNRTGSDQPGRHKSTGLERRRQNKAKFSEDAPTHPLEPAWVLEQFAAKVSELFATADTGSGPALAPQEVKAALRQAVLDVFRSREQHVAHLAEIDRYVQNPRNSPRTARVFIAERLKAAGLRRITDPAETEHFVLTGNGDGGDYLVVADPGYVDEVTGRLVLAGQLYRSSHPPSGKDSMKSPESAEPPAGNGTKQEQ
jgi:hypothetical protein